MSLTNWLATVQQQLCFRRVKSRTGRPRVRGGATESQSLESRILLTTDITYIASLLRPHLASIDGVTVVTHGFQPDASAGDSLNLLSSAIRDRADAENGTQQSAWLLDYDVRSEGTNGFFDVDLSATDDGAGNGSILAGSPADLVLQFDWAPESNEPSSGWGEAAGDALFNMMVGLGLVIPEMHKAVAPIHFIGHSFGTAVTSEAVERLATFSIPVDQVTYLDPHDFDEFLIPIDEDQRLFELGKPAGYGAAVWNNVAFTDVYYQVLPTPEPEGRPIPGAYNQRLTYSELPVLSIPHIAVWENYYLNTVSDSPSNGTTGYAFSRVAQGSDLRPSAARPTADDLKNPQNSYSFYSTDQYHGHTPVNYQPATVTNATERARIASAKQTSHWSSVSLINGGFSNPGDRYDTSIASSSNLIPGWSHHGGTGSGNARYVPGSGNYVLELGPAGFQRSHNRAYLSTQVGGIAFDWRKVIAGNAGDRLVVEVDGQVIETINVSSASVSSGSSDWNTQHFTALPDTFRGKSSVVGFRLINSNATPTIPTTTVQIDNLIVVTGGNTGDVIPIDLAAVTEHATGSDFLLRSLTARDTSGNNIPVTVRVNQRGDWEVRQFTTPQPLLATILFTDRMGDGTTFRDTGRLFLAPGTSSAISDGVSSPTGFQGTITLNYAVTSEQSGLIVEESQSLDLKITDGYSGGGSLMVTSQPGLVTNAALQQRLNFLRERNYSANSVFTGVAPLAVDGIVGPLTRDMLQRYKALATVPAGTPSAQSTELDPYTLLRLNGSGGGLSPSERQSLSQGLRTAGDKLGFGTLDKLKAPLPLVGTTTAETKSVPTTPKDEVSLASALSIDVQLRDKVFKPLAAYIESSVDPTLTGAKIYLESVGIDPELLIAFTKSTAQPNRNSFTIVFAYQAFDLNRTLRLGEKAAVAGLSASQQIPINLTTTLTGSFEFGVDLTKPILDDAFYLKINSLTATASASVPSSSLVNLDILGRFLRLDVSSGNLNLAAAVNISSSEITLRNLIGSSLASLVNIPTPTATVTGGFSTTASLFGTTHTGSIVFNDTNILDSTPIDVSITGYSDGLKNLLTIGSQSFKDALGQLGTAIDGLRNTSLFDVSLGLTKGLDAGNAIKLKEAFDAAITSQFSGNNAVRDLNELLSRLAASTGSYNPTTGQLTMNVDLSRALIKQSGVVGFDADLGPLGSFSSSSLADIQADANLKFTLGINLNGAIGSGFTLSNATLLTTLNGSDGTTPVTYDHDKLSSTPEINRWSLADRPGETDSVRFTLADGTNFDAVLDNLTTVGAVINTINTAAATALDARYATLYSGGSTFARLDQTTKAFAFLDKTRGEAAKFSITGLNSSSIGLAGIGLGIYGSSTTANSDGNYEIVGAPLHNDSLASRLYLVSTSANRPTLGGSVVVSATDIDASLKVLIAEAQVVNGSGTARANVNLTLDGAAASDGKVTLQEILDANTLRSGAVSDATNTGTVEITSPLAHGLKTGEQIQITGVKKLVAGNPVDNTAVNGTWTVTVSATDVTKFSLNGSANTAAWTDSPDAQWTQLSNLAVTPGFSGSMNVTLPITAKAPWLAANQVAFGNVIVSWPDLTSTGTLNVTHTGGLDQLFDFSNLDAVDVANALTSVTEYLSNFEQFKFLQEKLPLLNKSLAELVGIGAKFTEFVKSYKQQPVNTLLQLQSAMQTALGVPVIFAADGRALKISFDFSKAIDEQLNINLDLGSLGIGNLDGLVDVRGEGKVRLAANANFHIDLGIDMSNPESPRPFLYSNTTTAGLSAKVWGKDLDFSASVLSFGVKIDNGYVAIDSDGVAETSYNANDKVSYSVAVTDTQDGNADGRVYLTNLSAANLHENPLAGQFHVNLPMFKKSDGSSINALDWNFVIANSTTPYSWDNVPDINSSPNFSALLTNLNLSSELDGFAGGIEDFFTVIDTAIENQALIAKLPLIGDALVDAVRFVGDIRDKISDNLQVFGPKSALVVQQKIYEALGPGGLNWLRNNVDQNAATWRTDLLNIADISVDDVRIVVNSNDDVRYSVRLKQSLARVTVPVDFDLGLPLIGLDVDGQVQLDVGSAAPAGIFFEGFGNVCDVGDRFRLQTAQRHR